MCLFQYDKILFSNAKVLSGGQNSHDMSQNTNVCQILTFTDQGVDNSSLNRRPECFEWIHLATLHKATKPFKCQSQHNACQFNVHLTVIMQM